MKFSADEMLGKLARWLRMSGFDVSYARALPDAELISTARQQNRIILTRDTKLIQRLNPEEFLFITQNHLKDQMQEFYARYPKLKTHRAPLTRCVECNAALVPIAKELIKDRVWPFVYQTQERFHTCPSCQRLYWEATHVKKIRQALDKLIDEGAS